VLRCEGSRVTGSGRREGEGRRGGSSIFPSARGWPGQLRPSRGSEEEEEGLGCICPLRPLGPAPPPRQENREESVVLVQVQPRPPRLASAPLAWRHRRRRRHSAGAAATKRAAGGNEFNTFGCDGTEANMGTNTVIDLKWVLF
jgi:hypothetical protein